MSKTAVTSGDVARRASVSQSAVSRAFTPGASVSPKTREKILKAAAELGYRPQCAGPRHDQRAVAADCRPRCLSGQPVLSDRSGAPVAQLAGKRLPRASVHDRTGTSGRSGPADSGISGRGYCHGLCDAVVHACPGVRPDGHSGGAAESLRRLVTSQQRDIRQY